MRVRIPLAPQLFKTQQITTYMENLYYYQKFAPVPESAKKPIKGGKLNGKTDINPMWRIKTLTETFGPVGFGWYTEITEQWVERDAHESAAWVKINLYIKDPDTGEWSKPIQGIGGSKQYGSGIGDGLINDEAFKMAETDAISVACKKLGMGASVYWDKDGTKYTTAAASVPTAAKKPATKPTATASKPASAGQTEKPVITQGNELWPKAIAYCIKHGRNAVDLRVSYTIDDETAKKMQERIDFQRELQAQNEE